MSEFTREEVEKAFQDRLAIQDRDDWAAFGETFTDDAVYVEHHEGTFEGKPKILEWLVPVMQFCEGWTYPIEWTAIDGDRVIYKWLNRLPGTRPDGGYYEFAGMSVAEYAGDGKWSYQEDLYNWEVAEKVIKEWGEAKAGG